MQAKSIRNVRFVTVEELIKMLSDMIPDVDFENEKELVTGHVIDSFDIISIVNELNKKYDIKIKVNDMTPENFDSAEAMLGLIDRLK